eukprot:g24373.t1
MQFWIRSCCLKDQVQREIHILDLKLGICIPLRRWISSSTKSQVKKQQLHMFHHLRDEERLRKCRLSVNPKCN